MGSPTIKHLIVGSAASYNAPCTITVLSIFQYQRSASSSDAAAKRERIACGTPEAFPEALSIDQLYLSISHIRSLFVGLESRAWWKSVAPELLLAVLTYWHIPERRPYRARTNRFG